MGPELTLHQWGFFFQQTILVEDFTLSKQSLRTRLCRLAPLIKIPEVKFCHFVYVILGESHFLQWADTSTQFYLHVRTDKMKSWKYRDKDWISFKHLENFPSLNVSRAMKIISCLKDTRIFSLIIIIINSIYKQSIYSVLDSIKDVWKVIFLLL